METTKKRPSGRHFPYQHPTFGYKNRPKPESAWKKSVYYWWWAYLKRNADYVACCENGGKGKMSALYADFGDVRGDDFKEWWTQDGRGVRLFAEPRAEDSFRVLQKDEVVAGDSGTLVLSIPLNLPKKFLEQHFRKLLKIYHEGLDVQPKGDDKRGHQYAKHSQAKYRFTGQPNLKAIRTTLEIYEYRLANPDMTLWEIGNSSPRIDDKLKLANSDGVSELVDKKYVLASTVSRYLRKAKQYIEATGRGYFLSEPPSGPKSA